MSLIRSNTVCCHVALGCLWSGVTLSAVMLHKDVSDQKLHCLLSCSTRMSLIRSYIVCYVASSVSGLSVDNCSICWDSQDMLQGPCYMLHIISRPRLIFTINSWVSSVYVTMFNLTLYSIELCVKWPWDINHIIKTDSRLFRLCPVCNSSLFQMLGKDVKLDKAIYWGITFCQINHAHTRALR